MRKWLRKLWNDERGNALIIAAGAMPLVVGSAGLATDTIQFTLLKRQLQRAADSAALAGALAKYQGDDAAAAITNELGRSNRTGLTTTSTTAYPADTADQFSQVQLTLRVSQRLPFSSFFTGTAQGIEARATAAAVNSGEYCLVALSEVNTDITLIGNPQIALHCGSFANKASGSPYDAGGSARFSADPIAAAGPIAPSAVYGTATLQPYRPQQQDPFAGKYSTDVPTGTTCTSFASHVVSSTVKTVQKFWKLDRNDVPLYKDVTVTEYTMSPGCYNDFSTNSTDNFVLQPGIYYLWNTDFKVNGSASITGTGVAFVLTGTAGSVGTLAINGDSELKLTAPQSGGTAGYEDMLFVQSTLATASSTINGNSTSYFDGALYFPKTEIKLNGNNSGLTNCAMMVANIATFAGNATIENDTSSCQSRTHIPLKVVRLVA